LSGYVVSYVAFENGKPVGTPKNVVTGFTSADQNELFGAPVGVAQDRDGGLLIADDVGNTVWRVTGAGS
jgi:glucose/arabinose dehydrogenase